MAAGEIDDTQPAMAQENAAIVLGMTAIVRTAVLDNSRHPGKYGNPAI